MIRCDMCGKFVKDAPLQPSRSQLLFGGFRVQLERRCGQCERQVSAWVKGLLKQ